MISHCESPPLVSRNICLDPPAILSSAHSYGTFIFLCILQSVSHHYLLFETSSAHHGRDTVLQHRVSVLSVSTPPRQFKMISDRESANIKYSTISIPLPTRRLASSALQTFEVDTELSPYVRRTLTLVAPPSETSEQPQEKKQKQDPEEAETILQTTYCATTNRMLRVAVNGFMESLGVVLGVMTELDVDVLKAEMDV